MGKSRLIVFLFCITGMLSAESLWDSNFSGYATTRPGFSIGDTLLVSIQEDSILSYSLEDSAQTKIVLSSSKKGEGLFSFLSPETGSSSRTVKGESRFSLNARVNVRIEQITESGALLVSGTRTRSAAGRVESVSVSGEIDPDHVDFDGTIPMERLFNGQLTYTILGSENEPAITAEALSDNPEENIQITDEAQRELLLSYLNRMLAILQTD